MQQDIRIVPIFNQMKSPKIWTDFTRLEMLCDTVKYGYSVDNSDKKRIYDGHVHVLLKPDPKCICEICMLTHNIMELVLVKDCWNKVNVLQI